MIASPGGLAIGSYGEYAREGIGVKYKCYKIKLCKTKMRGVKNNYML